jgi:DeoR/GlpR family transcriptional regulator of sugar metabolism
VRPATDPTVSPLLGPGRQRELLSYIRAYGVGSVNDMARLFGVSASTVRRDLNSLHGRGLVERIHGGASNPDNSLEPLRPVREVAFAAEKRRIGQAAAAHVADHSTVLISGGTTTEAMLAFLGPVRGLTVLTNSLGVVNRLIEHSDAAIVVLGGLLRRDEMSLLGHLTTAGLDEFAIDQVFAGAFGVDPDIGVSGTNLYETSTDRSLATSAHELIMLADHSKLARRGPARIIPTGAITTLIVDDGADAGTLDRFRAAGVSVETC